MRPPRNARLLPDPGRICIEQIQKAAQNNRRSVLFPYRHEFDPYFVGLQPVESDTLASEIPDTCWNDRNTLFSFDQRKHGLHHVGFVFNTWRVAGVVTDGRNRIEQCGRTFAMEQNKTVICQIGNAHRFVFTCLERGSTAINGSL